jgi:hypothetical protein
VRSRAAHELDEVPVLAGRVTVALDVTDDFGVDLRSGVEAEGGLDLLVLQVTVDGLGAANDLDGSADALVVFCEDCSVGVGVVTTDDDQRTDIELLEDLEPLVELSRSSSFVRPEPMMSKPPVLRYSSMMSAVSSM